MRCVGSLRLMGGRSRAVTAEASLNCQRKALNFIPTFLKAFCTSDPALPSQISLS
jgi:hypothetical protein